MKLTLTPLAEAGVTLLPPDIVWDGTRGDFARVASPADGPAGGLVGAHPIRTEIVMRLFTDGRADPDDLRFEHQGDPRGWPGAAMPGDTGGSRLWLFRRSVLSDLTAREVAAEAERALQPMIAQGLAARVTASATADKVAGKIFLSIGVYGRDGAQTYADRFDLLWRQPGGP